MENVRIINTVLFFIKDKKYTSYFFIYFIRFSCYKKLFYMRGPKIAMTRSKIPRLYIPPRI